MESASAATRVGTALFGKVRLAILSLLFDCSDRSFYLNQIVRALAMGKGAVQRELAGLTAAGLLVRRKEGRHVYYQANRAAPIFDEVESFVRKGIAHVHTRSQRVALTGGPGGGKTTLLGEIRSRDGREHRFLTVPEAATILLGAGLRRQEKSFQLGIVRLQLAMEDAVAAAASPEQVVVCDRGTVDSLAYWKLNGWDEEEFFEKTGLSQAEHLGRYDLVVHLQTTAVGAQAHYASGSEAGRSEGPRLAAQIDDLMATVCSGHPNVHLIKNSASGWKPKSQAAMAVIDAFLDRGK